MMKLSDTQLVILSAACQRDDALVLPLPDHLKGGAASTVIASLTAKGLIEEVEARRGDPVWRDTGDGHGVTLVATEAAHTALGITDEAPTTMDDAPAPIEAKVPRKAREGTKQATLIEMLRASDGATIAEIVAATGWQPHYADVRIMPM